MLQSIQIEKRIGVDMLKKAACFSLLRVGWVLWAGQGERRCATTIPAISKNSFPLPLPLFGLPHQPKKGILLVVYYYLKCNCTNLIVQGCFLLCFLTCPYPQNRVTRQSYMWNICVSGSSPRGSQVAYFDKLSGCLVLYIWTHHLCAKECYSFTGKIAERGACVLRKF